ncbi:general secretion pathway protein GspC [Pantoea sp. Tr-811]|uniref:type II secretion system protein N n=1 Tax=Pantoea sp. Tr-811 TaxID=2608361 RepID=UPI00141DE671|nr:type II secretion system protein N [Pantoea sp. Tr-811]NIF25126.1 general secretion pathway protein GspC [Pantoea sp. Tr-811]
MSFQRLYRSPGLLLQGLGGLVAVAGAVTWAWVLAPAAALPTQAQAAATAPLADTGAGRWFADLPAQVDIRVSGVLSGRAGTVAIISLDGGPAQAVEAGDELARGVKLVAIEQDGLVIERAGERSRVEVPALAVNSFL